MARITDELKPSFLIFENVPGLLSSDNGRDFARVLGEMDRIGYCGAWTVLDARFFGVAQRRRRIFGVFARNDIGAERCAEILSFPTRLQWNPEKGRKTREGIAGTLKGGSGRRGYPDPCDGNGGGLVAFSASGFSKFEPTDTGTGLRAMQHKQTDVDLVVGTLSPGAHPGRFNGQDAYTNNLVVAIDARNSKEQRDNISGTLQAKNNGGYSLNYTNPVIVKTDNTTSNGWGVLEDGTTHTLGGTTDAVNQGVGVRRLTPIECERLQGFPDGWTAIDADGKEVSDSARYRMLGNAVAVPCAEWIGKRITS